MPMTEKFYYYARDGGIRCWEPHDKYVDDRPLNEGEKPDFVGTFTPEDVGQIEKGMNDLPGFWDPRTKRTYVSVFRLPLLGWYICKPFKIAIPTNRASP